LRGIVRDKNNLSFGIVRGGGVSQRDVIKRVLNSTPHPHPSVNIHSRSIQVNSVVRSNRKVLELVSIG
jgi:hypothetical protein